jgi:hypothetical protein
MAPTLAIARNGINSHAPSARSGAIVPASTCCVVAVPSADALLGCVVAVA